MRKQKFFTKALAMVLASAMILSLAACGGKDGKDGENKSGAATEAEQYGGKEFVYAASFMDIDYTGYLDNGHIKDNYYYFLGGDYNEATQTYTQTLYKMDLTAGKIAPEEAGLKTSAGINDTEAWFANDFAILSDGSLVVQQRKSSMNGDDLENWLVHIDADGNEISKKDITEDIKVEGVDYSYISAMIATKDDEIVLHDGENKVWKFDKEGNLLATADIKGIQWVQSTDIVSDGTIVLTGWGEEGGQQACKVNFDTKSTEKWLDFTGDAENLDIEEVLVGKNDQTYVRTADALFELNTETGATTEVLKWLDSDIASWDIRQVFCAEEDEFGVIMGDGYEDDAQYEVGILRKTAVADMPVKEIITLGTFSYSGGGSDSQKAIVNFNRKSDKYRVEVIPYMVEEGEDAWQKAVEAFNNDLLAGTGPDVLEASNLNTERLTSKGLLVDLGEYLDKDPDISRDDYFKSVLETNTSKEGTLYCIPNSFTVMTLAGWKEDVGDKQGWTVDEAKAVFEKNKGKDYMYMTDRQSALAMLLYTNYDQFINWQEGTCNFNNDDFTNLLEIANMFPKETPNNDEYDPAGGIIDHTTLIYEAYISSMNEYLLTKAIFGDDASKFTLIGFPGNEGNGARISTNGGYAINAAAKNKDACWEFVKSFISPDSYKASNSWQIPSLRSAFDAQLEKLMVPETYVDENGEEQQVASIGYGMGNHTFEIFPPTQEDVDAFMDLIDNARGSINYDQFIYGIIEEEAGAFFDGGKTAQDAAAVIQSRIQTYLDEND